MQEQKIFDFSDALKLIKAGAHMSRAGWNGKGMFVYYQKGYPDGIPCNKNTAEAARLNEGDIFKCNPYLQIRNPNGSYSMWVPSINDILAEDWSLLEDNSMEKDISNYDGYMDKKGE